MRKLGVRETAEKVALAHEADKEKEKKKEKEKEKEKKATTSFWSKKKETKGAKGKGAKSDPSFPSIPPVRTATLAQIDIIEKVCTVCLAYQFLMNHICGEWVSTAFRPVFYAKDTDCGGFIPNFWPSCRGGQVEG